MLQKQCNCVGCSDNLAVVHSNGCRRAPSPAMWSNVLSDLRKGFGPHSFYNGSTGTAWIYYWIPIWKAIWYGLWCTSLFNSYFSYIRVQVFYIAAAGTSSYYRSCPSMQRTASPWWMCMLFHVKHYCPHVHLISNSSLESVSVLFKCCVYRALEWSSDWP